VLHCLEAAGCDGLLQRNRCNMFINHLLHQHAIFDMHCSGSLKSRYRLVRTMYCLVIYRLTSLPVNQVSVKTVAYTELVCLKVCCKKSFQVGNNSVTLVATSLPDSLSTIFCVSYCFFKVADCYCFYQCYLKSAVLVL